MTCIAALVDKGKVYMAGDSAVGDRVIETIGEGTAKIAIKKFSDGQEFLVGVSGDGRMGQLVIHRRDISIPPPGSWSSPETVMDWLVNDVCNLLSSFTERTKEGGEALPGRLLLGIKGRLYVIGNELHVHSVAEGYTAIGSGASFALGALFATKDQEPAQRLRQAMEATEHWMSSVRGPFTYLTL